jgi:release factor glutamine methyltransferase
VRYSSNWVKKFHARLSQVTETPALDAQVLLAHILGRKRSWLLAHPEINLNPEQSALLENGLKRLERGEPLPYIIRRREFYGLDFLVTPQVLIPRPETELLVEQALVWLRSHPGSRMAVDVGTGSGCIALAIAVNTQNLHVLAIDRSWEALNLARENLRHYAVQARVELVQADLLTAISKPVDLICANLPYIPSGDLKGLKVAQWEPRLALDGGQDGLDLIRQFLEQAPLCLAPGGMLLMEIEANQGQTALELAQRAFAGAQIVLLHDLAGLDRLVRIQSGD